MKHLITFILLSGCAPSEEIIETDFDRWISEHNQCETVDDCVEIYPGCPLGCATAVNTSYEEDALTKASELISEYEIGGQSCNYDCIVPKRIECAAHTCTIVF